MKLYLAPMEGITGYIYRNAFNEYFGGIDKYFSPFISPATGKSLKSKELRDTAPENNKGIKIIPQVLTNDAEGFLETIKKLSQFGYEEFNINIGCPSGTVVSKKKGAGLLADTYILEKFLDGVFSKTDKEISVKTRLGMSEPDEFEEILKIYNKFPISELIIHSRVRQDFYKNMPNIEKFKYASKNSKIPICYNGDIFIKSDFDNIVCEVNENLSAIMLGRGIIANPSLALEIRKGEKLNKNILREFHNRLLSDYSKVISGEKNIVFKMKELWFYMIYMFRDCDKYLKIIRKTAKYNEYINTVNALFENCELDNNAGFMRTPLFVNKTK